MESVSFRKNLVYVQRRRENAFWTDRRQTLPWDYFLLARNSGFELFEALFVSEPIFINA